MDIPFLSSTWAPDSSDTHCTSSEQSILQSCTCYSAAECERLNLRAQATQVAPRCRQAPWEQSRATSVSSENVGWWLAHCNEALVRAVWLLTLHHPESLIIYLTSIFFLHDVNKHPNETEDFILKEKSLYFLSLHKTSFPVWSIFPAVDFGCQGAKLHIIEQRFGTFWLVSAILVLECFRLSWAK